MKQIVMFLSTGLACCGSAFASIMGGSKAVETLLPFLEEIFFIVQCCILELTAFKEGMIFIAEAAVSGLGGKMC